MVQIARALAILGRSVPGAPRRLNIIASLLTAGLGSALLWRWLLLLRESRLPLLPQLFLFLLGSESLLPCGLVPVFLLSLLIALALGGLLRFLRELLLLPPVGVRDIILVALMLIPLAIPVCVRGGVGATLSSVRRLASAVRSRVARWLPLRVVSWACVTTLSAVPVGLPLWLWPLSPAVLPVSLLGLVPVALGGLLLMPVRDVVRRRPRTPLVPLVRRRPWARPAAWPPALPVRRGPR